MVNPDIETALDQSLTLRLIRKNRLCENIAFADGIGSSGKGMLSHILGSFTRVEKQSNHTPFDYIAYVHWLGKISTDAAITYLQTEADQQLYHIMMSRDVNFRPKDSTGVMQNAKRWKYIARLFMAEGDEVLERIKLEKPILNEAPHDALRSAPLFFEAFGNALKIIYIIRNPYELILDWNRRRFGSRIGADPREFQFSVSLDQKIVPMFMVNYQQFEYSALSATERLVLMIHFCVQSNLEGFMACSEQQKKNIQIITFDDLCIDTTRIVSKVSSFLEVLETRETKKILKRENLPRQRPESQSFRSMVVDGLDKSFDKFVEELDDMYQRFLDLR